MCDRYYLGHFVDSYRQAGIDIMQGQTIDDEDVENCSSELQTAISIAQALVPLSAPMYMSDIALGPEMNFMSALYHMTRCVPTMILTATLFVYSILSLLALGTCYVSDVCAY